MMIISTGRLVLFFVIRGVLSLIGLGLRYLWLSYLRGEPRRMIERLPSLEFFFKAVGAFETTHCGICQTMMAFLC
jgi:hypothetical protein